LTAPSPQGRGLTAEEFASYSLPVAPVNKLIDLPQIPGPLRMVTSVDFDHPELGKIKIPGYPMQF